MTSVLKSPMMLSASALSSESPTVPTEGSIAVVDELVAARAPMEGLLQGVEEARSGDAF